MLVITNIGWFLCIQANDIWYTVMDSKIFDSIQVLIVSIRCWSSPCLHSIPYFANIIKFLFYIKINAIVLNCNLAFSVYTHRMKGKKMRSVFRFNFSKFSLKYWILILKCIKIVRLQKSKIGIVFVSNWVNLIEQFLWTWLSMIQQLFFYNKILFLCSVLLFHFLFY